MISLTLTNVKKFMSQLLMTETFDRFSFIEGEIVTFNTFKLDGYLQKDFFDAPAKNQCPFSIILFIISPEYIL